jgi:hypothetical protein
MTVSGILEKLGVQDNVSFYGGQRGKKDLILNMVWQKDFLPDIQSCLSSVDRGVRTKNENFQEEAERAEITIDDCFEEFKKPEILDEDNKWYCNKCKEHVQATKILEIYRAPPIFIINLKRFKQSKSRYGMGMMFSGGTVGQKMDSSIDFPLEGLDISKYITCS